MINVICSVLNVNSNLFVNLELIKNFDADFDNINFIIKSVEPVDENLIEQYPFVSVISGSDSGIYDAWNQALKLILPGWVIFLGDDDYLNKEFFNFALNITPDSNSCLVSDVDLSYPSGERVGIFKAPESTLLPTKNMNFSHPGTFFSSDIYDCEFDTDYKVISDYIYYSHRKITIQETFNGIGVIMTQGGVSNNAAHSRKVLLEMLRAWSKNKVSINISFLLARLVGVFLSWLPQKQWMEIRTFYWKIRGFFYT